MQRGDVHRFRLPKGLGHEQHGTHYGVIVQADALLPRSVVLVAPTSRSRGRRRAVRSSRWKVHPPGCWSSG